MTKLAATMSRFTLLTMPRVIASTIAFSCLVLSAADGPARRDPAVAAMLELFPDSSESGEQPVLYEVEQVVQLDDIAANAKRVRLWVSVPHDDVNQRLLNFKVTSAPSGWSIVHDADRRGRFVAIDVENPKSTSIEVAVSFRLRRDPVYVSIDAEKVGDMDESLNQMLSEHLDRNAPHMQVTPEFQEIADKVCGGESNVANQARLILEHVAATVDHYSYSTDPNMPHCGVGDAAACRKQGGGCCTDLNSYFITLARARGIAARLNMGYRLQEKNRNKLVDAGYRCWVEYFVPNYGWISADVAEADAPGGLGHERWFSGLTSRRLSLNHGREFRLAKDTAVPRINHMSIGYAEIDGAPVRLLPEGALPPQLTRQVRFTEMTERDESEAASTGE